LTESLNKLRTRFVELIKLEKKVYKTTDKKKVLVT